MIPKIIKSIELQLIMPCFCAGAHQTEPELRAASFRGELRWWFRCLGGTREQEKAVFGGVHDECRASAVALQVLRVKSNPGNYRWEYEKPAMKPNSSYITYFLTANEKNATQDTIIRSEAWLSPGLKFTLELRQMRSIDEASMELLLLAWDCLCNLGAVGARKTRALGAYAPVNPEEQKVSELVVNETFRKHFQAKHIAMRNDGHFTDGAVTTKILTICAQRLKEYRHNLGIHPSLTAGQKRNEEAYYGISALGNAVGGRQTSALRFRPVLIKDTLAIYLLKAPDTTLGETARLHNIDTL